MTPNNDVISRAELQETIECHVTSVSVCSTAEEARGRTAMKNICLKDIAAAPAVDSIPVEWLIDRANDTKRAPLYRRYAQMLYEEWREEQMFGDIDHKCPFSKCGRCTVCKVLSINCDGEKYSLCEQFRIVTSVKEQEVRQ